MANAIYNLSLVGIATASAQNLPDIPNPSLFIPIYDIRKGSLALICHTIQCYEIERISFGIQWIAVIATPDGGTNADFWHDHERELPPDRSELASLQLRGSPQIEDLADRAHPSCAEESGKESIGGSLRKVASGSLLSLIWTRIGQFNFSASAQVGARCNQETVEA
ncbi:hypothetical protein BDP27DRAFT_1369055 [Rhodocollybia butyracea]|uniref:Uncharacterized protein n=1 Tax=Rhodocollybia butyracea TaxID=206335 RepID=A0A9P5PE33_9AGAR|nr:hypothetical protein BDP27DRAFT_1369055 [Rhodocollybia butyracea]